MKRYNNLYYKVYDMDNLLLAHKNAKRGKSHYREVKKIEKKPVFYLLKIQKMLKEKTFVNSEYTHLQRTMENGKVRDIAKLPYFPDRIIHHAIIQVVGDIWVKSFIKSTYACIKGRGIHQCVKKIKEDLRNKDATKYCLKMDVRKFYPSVKHDVMKQIIRKKIKDKEMLWLLDAIIDSEPGLPIGNYLSQFLGNLYLSELDHIIKEKLHCKYYYRYCDDMVILGDNKNKLHKIKKIIEIELSKLKLEMKDNWQIFPVDDRGIDFLGYRFFQNYTLLRKSIFKRYKRKLSNIKRDWEEMEAQAVICSVMSYFGWMKYCNSKNMKSSLIDSEIFWIVKQKSKELGIRNPLQGIV